MFSNRYVSTEVDSKVLVNNFLTCLFATRLEDWFIEVVCFAQMS